MTRSGMKFALILSAASAVIAAPACAQHSSALHDYEVVTVAEGLEHPWGMAFLPNGDMLVTERPGRLRMVRNGQLVPTPVSGVPEVRARGQGGLLDVQVHPDFASNRLVYITYSKPRNGGEEGTTALIRGRLEGNALVDVEEVFEANAWGRRGQHFGSRIVFDGNGHVFISIGDRGNSPGLDVAMDHPSQSTANHIGTIVRLNEDGSIPSDNPFVGVDGAEPAVWSYGHRNPQGLAIQPATGELFDTEHGPQGGDELNHIRPGLNYGWPVIGYGVNYGGAEIHSATERAGMEQPQHYWVPSIATAGLMFYTGDAFPGWRGNAFVGGMAGLQIARLTMNGTEVTDEETLLQNVGRVRDIEQGPDGFIYVAFDAPEGSIARLQPAR